jgi:hypothetical protein
MSVELPHKTLLRLDNLIAISQQSRGGQDSGRHEQALERGYALFDPEFEPPARLTGDG